MMLVCTGGSYKVGLLYCDTGGIHDMEMYDFDFCDNVKSPPGVDCRAWTIITIYTCEDINLTQSTIQLTARRNFAEPTANAMLNFG